MTDARAAEKEGKKRKRKEKDWKTNMPRTPVKLVIFLPLISGRSG